MTVSSLASLRETVIGSPHVSGYDNINQTDQMCQVLEESLSFWQSGLFPTA